MKKILNQFGLFLSPFGILISISLLWSFAIKPQVIEYARNQIPNFNASQPYVELSVMDLDVSFLKLQLGAGRIKLYLKDPSSPQNPIEIKRIRFQIDPFKLLVGQVSLSKIQIDQMSWKIENLQKSDTKIQELPIDQIFKILPQIPIDHVFIANSEFNFKDTRAGLNFVFKIPHISLQNRKSSLGLIIKGLRAQSNDPQQTQIQAELDLTADLRKEKDNAILDLSQLSLKSLDSAIEMTGRLDHLKNLIQKPEGNLRVDSEIHFDDLRTIGLILFPQKSRMPAITGSVKTNGELSFKSFNNINGQLSIQTKQVNIDHFKLGQAQMQAVIKKNQILINRIEIEHPSALATFKDVEIEQKPPYHFKALAHLKRFDLQKLFLSIGLPDIPAGTSADGAAQCSGLVEPEFKVDCDVDTTLQNIWVKPKTQATFSILKIKNANVKGRFEFNLHGFNYKAHLQVGESSGSSEGEVSFAEGFKLNYETENLNFTDIESLADLNFKGNLKIKGTTSGDSNHGLMDANLVFSNAEIDHFKLGRFESKLKYEKANLDLKNILGLIGKSTYDGNAHFDFINSTLSSSLDLKDLYGEDILTALKERFQIPFNLTGHGQANLDLNGPFNFWKLNYILHAHLNQGQIADEGFETLQLNLNATGDAIHFNQSFLKKNKSKLQVDGEITTTEKEPQLALQIKSHPFLLEESDHVTRLIPHLTGQIWMDGYVKGPLDNPELAFNFSAKQVSYENNDYPSSQGFMAFNKKNFKFNGQLFGRQIQSDLVWPWSETDPYSLRLQIRDLNPLMLLPALSIPQPSAEFYSRLNADVDLKANQRHLKNSEGSIKVSDFMLQRGALYLKLNKAASLYFKNGLNQMDPIELKGEANDLQISLLNTAKNETKITVSGDAQLRLFQFLVPFAQTLSGRIQVDSQILFHPNEFELLGDGEITDGLVGLKNFPQAIENINTPLQFSKSKILFSDLSAQLGQNEITGQGQIDIKGAHQINVNIQASSDNIEITFPEKITTTGKADLLFYGSWLPYTMKVNYKVARGLIEKDFGSENASNKSALKSSPYLPPQQIEQQIPSLLLDVAIDLSQGVIIKNQLLEGEATGHLNITGTPENPILAGQVNIKPGSKLIFKDKPFDIQTATIKFPGTIELNPDIYMTANARVSDYDISLLVQGIPSKNLTIKPTSQPPLSEPDIFSLLALGLTSSKMDQNLSSETQQQQTGLEVLAAISNQSQINKKFQEKFGLTVQLAPTVDSTKNIAVPKVVVSKKIQKNVNASYSRPLTGDTQNQEWKLQYLFNPNKSIILNYQNIQTNQQDQIRNSNNNDQGILGLDFEYKKEFK